VSDGLITVESRFSVSETMDRLAAAAATAGLLVFARIDHRKGAHDAGLHLRPTELLIFGHPRGGTPLMLESQPAGIDLPFKALAWQDEHGRVWLTWNDAQWLAQRHRLGAASASAVQAISSGTNSLVAAATEALPWRAVDDEDGLWSFRVYGEAGADTVLVLLPGMGVPARYYAPLVRAWLNENVAVIQADFLAARVRPDAAGTQRDGFAALVEGCIPAIFDTVRQSLPRAAPIIVGHSLGGQLGLIAAARFAPDLPVALTASGSIGHRCFPGWRRWAVLAASQATRLVGPVLGYWPGDRLGFGGRQPTAVMRDCSYLARTGRFRAATGSFDYETVLREYRGDVLAISVDQDAFAPQTATEALLAKVPAARVARRTYAASRGTARPGAHFTWVKDQPGLAGVIAQWAISLRSE
jgi:uncharacterized protein (DUF302 family)/predicted alpha/beta hydrolase